MKVNKKIKKHFFLKKAVILYIALLKEANCDFPSNFLEFFFFIQKAPCDYLMNK